MVDEELAVLVVNNGSGLRILVLLVMHLALCSRCCRPSSSALELHLEICTLFLREHFPQSKFCASRFFGALKHSQL